MPLRILSHYCLLCQDINNSTTARCDIVQSTSYTGYVTDIGVFNTQTLQWDLGNGWTCATFHTTTGARVQTIVILHLMFINDNSLIHIITSDNNLLVC